MLATNFLGMITMVVVSILLAMLSAVEAAPSKMMPSFDASDAAIDKAADSHPPLVKMTEISGMTNDTADPFKRADARKRCANSINIGSPVRGPIPSVAFLQEERICATDGTSSVNVCARVQGVHPGGDPYSIRMVIGIVNYGKSTCQARMWDFDYNHYISGPALTVPGESCFDISDRTTIVGKRSGPDAMGWRLEVFCGPDHSETNTLEQHRHL